MNSNSEMEQAKTRLDWYDTVLVRLNQPVIGYRAPVGMAPEISKCGRRIRSCAHGDNGSS